MGAKLEGDEMKKMYTVHRYYGRLGLIAYIITDKGYYWGVSGIYKDNPYQTKAKTLKGFLRIFDKF